MAALKISRIPLKTRLRQTAFGRTGLVAAPLELRGRGSSGVIHRGRRSFLRCALLACTAARQSDLRPIQRSLNQLLALQFGDRLGRDHWLRPMRSDAPQMKSDYPFGHCSRSFVPGKKPILIAERGLSPVVHWVAAMRPSLATIPRIPAVSCHFVARSAVKTRRRLPSRL